MDKEIKFGFGLALSVGWGLFWRVALLRSIFSYTFDYFLGTTPFGSSLMAVLVHVIAIILIFIFSAYWLFSAERIGSMKIIFMEQADYQNIISNNRLQGDAAMPRS